MPPLKCVLTFHFLLEFPAAADKLPPSPPDTIFPARRTAMRKLFGLCLAFALSLCIWPQSQPKPAPNPDASPTQSTSTPPAKARPCGAVYYVNSSGVCVHRPVKSQGSGGPAGATAQCRDGSYSFSQHRRGTCSHHGGVAKWL